MTKACGMINSHLEQRDNSMAYTFLAANGIVIPSHNSAGKFHLCCQGGMSSTRHRKEERLKKWHDWGFYSLWGSENEEWTNTEWECLLWEIEYIYPAEGFE